MEAEINIFKCQKCGWSAASASPHICQIGGNHYSRFKIQPIEFIESNDLDFFQGNIIKYVCRYKYKNGLQDLEKAKDYIERLIKREIK